jgi:hypothetical protein
MVTAVADHPALRNAYGNFLATLVVPDRQLAEVARHIPAGVMLPISVVISGGAGGLIVLSRRDLPGLEVVSAEPPLRDLDDLAGSTARVMSAAAERGSEVAIFVEPPYAPGWEAAVQLVEATGLYGKIAVDEAEPRQTAEQLSILIEADLPFKITSRFRVRWLAVLTAVEALIDDTNIDEAAELLHSGNDQIGKQVAGSEQTRQSRVRRRLRRLGTYQVADVIKNYAVAGTTRDNVPRTCPGEFIMAWRPP